MGTDIVFALCPDFDATNRKAFAKLDQADICDQVTLCRFAQEIDGHIGGDRQGDGANGTHNRHIHPEICQGEHGRAADRAAGARMARVIGQPDPGRTDIKCLNNKPIMGGEGGIRREDVIQLGLGKFVRWHVFNPWVMVYLCW